MADDEFRKKYSFEDTAALTWKRHFVIYQTVIKTMFCNTYDNTKSCQLG